MDKDEKIRQRLKEVIRETVGETSILGTVKSVDEEEFTCTIKDDDSEIEYADVRLRPVVDGKEGLVVFPKVGTWALALRIETDEDYVVVSVGEVQRWKLKVGNAVFEQTLSGLIVKKDNDTLKDALDLILDAVSQIVVLQGTSPSYTKLAQAKLMIDNILTNGS